MIFLDLHLKRKATSSNNLKLAMEEPHRNAIEDYSGRYENYSAGETTQGANHMAAQDNLFSLVIQERWMEVIRRAMTHSHETSQLYVDPLCVSNDFQDIDIITPLIAALRRCAPFRVVKTFLAVNTTVASMLDSHERTPLHNYCYAGCARSVEITKLLVNAFPNACSLLDSSNLTPLQYACASREHASADVLRVLLEADASSICRFTNHDQCPMILWCDSFHQDLPWGCCSNDTFFEGTKGKHPSYFMHGDLDEFYNGLRLLLKTATDGNISLDYEYRYWKILHAGLKVPFAFSPIARYLIMAFPDQVYERDENGDLPLHILVSKEKYYIGSNFQKCMLELLLIIFPKSINLPNKEGRMALNIALENGCYWYQGVKTLVEAEPRALLVIDCTTYLYPFMQAAIYHTTQKVKQEEGEELRKLETIYHLILEAPHVLGNLFVVDADK